MPPPDQSSPDRPRPDESPPTAPSVGAARLLAVGVTTLWASSWVLIRWGGDESLPPLTFAALRYLLAGVVLAAWVAVRRRPQALRSSTVPWRTIAVLGIVQYAVTQGAQFVAIAHQPLAATSVVLAATPLLTVLAAGWIGEGATRSQLLAAALIVTGATIYFAGAPGATAIGTGAAVLGLVANAIAALYGRAALRDVARSPGTTLVLTCHSMLVGAVCLAVTALVAEGVPTVTGRATVLIAWLALVNTAAAFTWWNLCLRTVPAGQMAAINGLMMPQIACFGWLLFDERLGPRELVGLLAVVVGVFASTRSPRVTTPGTSGVRGSA